MDRITPPEIGLSADTLNEMEEKRIAMLDEAGIDEKEVLSIASDHQNMWQDAFNENIVRGKDDVNFTVRDQWTAVERSEFARLFKPCMTRNILYDSVKKVIGEQRKNRPELMVRNLTGKATQEMIDLRANIVRTISYQSQNDLVYQTAGRSALMLGFGAFEIDIDYETPMSFKRRIKYNLITDATRTAFDPSAVMPHKGDGDFCSRAIIMRRNEFFATFPYITNPESYSDPFMLLDFQWQTGDLVTFLKYSRKEWYPAVIYNLSDGSSVTEDQWKRREKRFEDNAEITKGLEVDKIMRREIPKIIGKRQTQLYQIRTYLMLKNQIIDFMDWPSPYLPIVFTDGDSQYIEGRQYTKSFIHEARDSQKLLNYSMSENAAELKNRRREQWLGTPDNIIGNEQQWRNPELQQGILVAKPDPKTGQMPAKMPAWEVSQGLFVTQQEMKQSIREVLGTSESDQLMGRDVSGKARRERKIETSMATYVFFDNLNQSIEQGGRIVLSLLPFVYTEEDRNIVISMKDGKTRNVTLNKKLPNGEMENVMSGGDYDIEIAAGPSFAVQKEVALEFLQATLEAFPQAFPLIADLWAANLDVQFMDQIKERLQTLVPPQILAKEKGEPPPPPQPNPQDQMMQMEMAVKQSELQNQQAEIQERAEELRIRREKHDLEKIDMLLKAREAQQKLQAQEKDRAFEAQKADLDFSGKIAKLLGDIHQMEAGHEHEAKMAKNKPVKPA
jgi:hypothetical protein